MQSNLKKSLVTVAVLGAFSIGAHAQSSVTLYGSLDAGLLYVNNAGGHSAWMANSSTLSNTYFGLRGAEDLGGGTKAIFRLESGFNLTNGAFSGNNGFNRQAYVGLQNDRYGTFTLGRQYDSVVDYLSPLSLAGQAGTVNVAAHPLNNDNIGGQYSIANAAKFESANYSGFHFGALYGFSNQAGGFANGRAWSVGAGYSNGPFKIAAAYDQSNSDPNAAIGNPNPAVTVAQGASLQRTYGVGANYTYGSGTVGLLWTHTKLQGTTTLVSAVGPLDARFDNVELNGTYGLTPALALVGNYTYTWGKTSGSGTESSSPKWHSVTLGADYSLSKRTDVYVAGVYQHASGDLYNNGQGGLAIANTTSIAGLLPPSSTPNQVGVTTGLRHRF